jgi:hypothetical protein
VASNTPPMREIIGLPLTTDDSSNRASGSSSSTEHFSGTTAPAAAATSINGITAVLNDGVLLVNNPASVSQVNTLHSAHCIVCMQGIT